MIEDKFLPADFSTFIRTQIGDEKADILLRALTGEPEVSLRLNRRKMPPLPLYDDATKVPWCESGQYLKERPVFTYNPLLHAGTFYVQDASSMIYETIVRSIAGDEPLRVADLCAAPGGKTTAIINALPDGSVILANEYVASRAGILKENLCKYGYPNTVITNTDASRLAEMRNFFDIVAVDAPCSGEGMMRKEESARSQWSEGLIRQCAALQREILESAVAMTAPGGFLIYSTCTFNTYEDEDNASFIAGSLGLPPVDTGLAGKWGIQKEVKGNIPALRFMPGFTKGEGLFVALFRKPDDDTSPRRIHGKINKKGNKDKCKVKTDPSRAATAASWTDTEVEIRNHEGHLLLLTPPAVTLLDSIPKGVRILAAGVEAGEIKGKDLIPAHALAMSEIMSHPFPEVELDTPDALRYLSKDAITLPSDTPKGFVTATYCGIPLGFLKNHGNRSNNLYPQEYRIRNKKY